MSDATGGAAPLVTALHPPPDPTAVIRQLGGLAHRVWLDSADPPGPRSRYSYITADPWASVGADHADPLGVLRAALAPHRAAPASGLPPFQGGAVGYLAYDFGRRLERLPSPHGDASATPDVWFGLYDWVIAWDHAAGRAWLVSTGLPATGRHRAERARERAALVQARLATPSHDPRARSGAGTSPDPPLAPVPGLGGAIGSSLARDAYLARVDRIRRYILAGDVFQVNLTQRLTAPAREDPLSFYLRLRRVNPAPFAAYVEPGPFVIASASPERFLRASASGAVETRPIKGTRPRGETPADDAALGAELLASEKDRAENVMIVDLLRNDLSRVCRPGSVTVPELCVLERFATVQHLVSTVAGHLAPGRDALDLLAGAFPGGSVTGAPKVRAMEIIAELEPVARGVYCGAIGYWSVTGDLDTSIAIRTCVLRDGAADFGVGGGIVADSDPLREYAETLDKARGIVAALAPEDPAAP